MKYDSVLLISIDALAKKYDYIFDSLFTTKYNNYRTTSTWTLPSHLTMLSGIPFSRLFVISEMKDYDKYEGYAADIPTIATLLRKHGFKSRAVTGGGFMSKFFGWGHDWDIWEEAVDINQAWNGEKIIPKKNEILFLHTYYVHDWFHANKNLKINFLQIKQKLDRNEKVNPKDYRLMIKEGKSEYNKRIKTLARRLKWINKLSKKTLVILLSDHAELFSTPGSFHHGNLALRDGRIFMVPLFLKENISKKQTINKFTYDFLIPKLIFDKLGIPFESVAKALVINNKKLKEENKINKEIIEKFQNSKTWKLLYYYKRISGFAYNSAILLSNYYFKISQKIGIKKLLKILRII